MSLAEIRRHGVLDHVVLLLDLLGLEDPAEVLVGRILLLNIGLVEETLLLSDGLLEHLKLAKVDFLGLLILYLTLFIRRC